jgi:hypothetical protein
MDGLSYLCPDLARAEHVGLSDNRGQYELRLHGHVSGDERGMGKREMEAKRISGKASREQRQLEEHLT